MLHQAGGTGVKAWLHGLGSERSLPCESLAPTARKHQPTAEKHPGSPGSRPPHSEGYLSAVCLSLPDPSASYALFLDSLPIALSWKQPEQKPTPPLPAAPSPISIPRAQGLPGDPVNN